MLHGECLKDDGSKLDLYSLTREELGALIAGQVLVFESAGVGFLLAESFAESHALMEREGLLAPGAIVNPPAPAQAPPCPDQPAPAWAPEEVLRQEG